MDGRQKLEPLDRTVGPAAPEAVPPVDHVPEKSRVRLPHKRVRSMINPQPRVEISNMRGSCWCSPFGRARQVWDTIMSFLLIYCLTVWPFTMSFIPADDPSFFTFLVIDAFLDAAFILDIAVNLRTGVTRRSMRHYVALSDDDAVEKESSLIFECKAAFVDYFWRGSMLFDLVAAIPLGLVDLILFMEAQYAEGSVLFAPARYARLLRLVRLHRGAKAERLCKFESVSTMMHFGFGMWRNRLYQTLLKMVTLAAFLSHVGACMWWAVGHSEGMGTSAWVPSADLVSENRTLARQYSHALFWSFSTLVGMQDILPPETEGHMIVGTYMVIAGIAMNTYILGTSINLISELADVSRRSKTAAYHARSFLRDDRGTFKLTHRVVSHLDFVIGKSRMQEGSDWMEHLPPWQRLELNQAVLRKFSRGLNWLYKYSVFKITDEALLVDLVDMLVHHCCLAREPVMKVGTPSTFLLFLDAGVMSVKALIPLDSTTTPQPGAAGAAGGGAAEEHTFVEVRLFGSGDILGESVFHDVPRAADVTSMSTCYFYCLMKKQCDDLMARHKVLDERCVFHEVKKSSTTGPDVVQVTKPPRLAWNEVRRRIFKGADGFAKPKTLAQVAQVAHEEEEAEPAVVIYRRTAWVVKWVRPVSEAHEHDVALSVKSVQAHVGGDIELSNGAIFKNPKRSDVSPEFMRQQSLEVTESVKSPGKRVSVARGGGMSPFSSYYSKKKNKTSQVHDDAGAPPGSSQQPLENSKDVDKFIWEFKATTAEQALTLAQLHLNWLSIKLDKLMTDDPLAAGFDGVNTGLELARELMPSQGDLPEDMDDLPEEMMSDSPRHSLGAFSVSQRTSTVEHSNETQRRVEDNGHTTDTPLPE